MLRATCTLKAAQHEMELPGAAAAGGATSPLDGGTRARNPFLIR